MSGSDAFLSRPAQGVTTGHPAVLPKSVRRRRLTGRTTLSTRPRLLESSTAAQVSTRSLAGGILGDQLLWLRFQGRFVCDRLDHFSRIRLLHKCCPWHTLDHFSLVKHRCRYVGGYGMHDIVQYIRSTVDPSCKGMIVLQQIALSVHNGYSRPSARYARQDSGCWQVRLQHVTTRVLHIGQ